MIGAAIRRLVRARAGEQCEYCRTRQEDEAFATYPVEHITAIQHGGGDEDSNLALACTHCNLHKGPNLSGIDPETGGIVALFHPRRQEWDDHFERDGLRVLGKTPCGRATERVLAFNAPARLELRRAVQESDGEPPDD